MVPCSSTYDGKITTLNIYHFINEYFELTYGNLLEVDFSMGSYIVLIKGDPFILKIPGILGEVQIVVDKNISKSTDIKHSSKLNLLDCIEKLTPSLASSLLSQESQILMDEFLRNFNSFKIFNNRYKDYNYFFEALEDLKESIQIIDQDKTNYGIAKWGHYNLLRN